MRVRKFREQIARFLESDAPVAVTLGVYVPTPRKSVKAADMTELRAAADRLAATLSDAEEEIVAEFNRCVVEERLPLAVLDANILIRAVLGKRVRQVLETYAVHRIRFYAPEVAYADAAKYLPALLTRRRKSTNDNLFLENLLNTVEVVQIEEPLRYLPQTHRDWAPAV